MERQLDFEPLDASFGAVVHGLKLAQIDDKTWAGLHALWLDYALLIFPDQHLTRAQQISFAKRFGPLEFEMAAISNVRSDGSVRPEAGDDDVIKILKGNMGWHADSTYMPVQAKGAVFSAEVVPSRGGQTGFADMQAAYDALDVAMRVKVEQLTAHHSLYYSQSKLGHLGKPTGKAGAAADTALTGDAALTNKSGGYSGYGFHDGPVPRRPLVKVHPDTGRKCLAIGRHAHNIPGMSLEESERFLQQLVDAACLPPRVYHHNWSAGDTVVWDNRRLLHRATPWDMTEPRIMWHSRLAGDPVSEAALAA